MYLKCLTCPFLVWTQSFKQKYKLPFTLLSDEGNKVRKDWGVPSDLFGALPGRQTYVLDRNGVVRLVYNNQFQPEKHIDETLKFLQSLWANFFDIRFCESFIPSLNTHVIVSHWFSNVCLRSSFIAILVNFWYSFKFQQLIAIKCENIIIRQIHTMLILMQNGNCGISGWSLTCRSIIDAYIAEF